jgi:hypothetical protein
VEQEEDEWRRGHPEGATMEVDKDDENVGSEIDLGYYPLDFGIGDLGISELWIRQDYIRIYNYCQEFYNKFLGKRPIPRSVFITRQLGIGKWLLVTNFWL